MRVKAGFERCDDCGREYPADEKRPRQCPDCAAREDAEYRVPLEIPPPHRWSMPVIQERLSISGREDS